MAKKTETKKTETKSKKRMYDKLLGRDPGKVSKDSKLDPKVIKCFIMGFRGMNEPSWTADFPDYTDAYRAGKDTAKKK